MDSKVGLWPVPYLHEVLSLLTLSLRNGTRVRFSVITGVLCPVGCEINSMPTIAHHLLLARGNIGCFSGGFGPNIWRSVLALFSWQSSYYFA